MERLPNHSVDLVQLGKLVCDFVGDYETFIISDEFGAQRAVIFRHQDLKEIEFSESGQLEMDQVINLLPKAILPHIN